MKNPHALPVAAIAVAILAAVMAPAARASDYDYQIHFTNSTGQSVKIWRIWYRIVDATWECVARCDDSKKGLDDGEQWQKRVINALAGDMRYKWKFRWRCAEGDETSGHQHMTDWKITHRGGADTRVELTGCGEDDLTVTHDTLPKE